MADKKITDLPAASSVVAAQLFELVNGSSNQKATIAQLAAFLETLVQTLTNKTINGAQNTLTVRLGADVSGILPLDKQAAPTGTGPATVTGGAWDAAAASTTGTGAYAKATSPTFVTPVIGAATGTSLAASDFVESAYYRFPLGADPRAAAGKFRLSPYTNDIIAIREHNNAADRVAMSTWHSGSNVHILVLGAGQVALTPFDQVDLWVKNTGLIRAIVDGGTKWLVNTSGVQFGNGGADFGGGSGVIGIDNAATAPTTNPTAGIVLYVDSADNTLKYRKADGTIVSLSGGGGSPGGATTQVQFNDAGAFGGDPGLTYDKTNDRIAVTGGLDLGSGVATDGVMRVAGGFTMKSIVGGVNRPVLEATTGAVVILGGFNAGDCGGLYNRVSTGSDWRVQIGGVNQLVVTESSVHAVAPLAGWDGGSLPFRFQEAVITKSDATDLTLTAAQYQCPVLRITGTPGGNFNLIAPDTAKAFFIVENTTPSTCTIKKSAGTGVAIATAKTAQVRHSGTDYTRVTADA